MQPDRHDRARSAKVGRVYEPPHDRYSFWKDFPYLRPHVLKLDTEGSLVVVVLDVNPVWWGLQDASKDKGLTLFECVDHIIAFINSHLMINYKNKVAVIASHTNESRFLYPSKELNSNALEDSNRTKPITDGKYEHFAKVDDAVQEELKRLLVANPTVLHTDTLLAGSLAMGLCYMHRIQKEHAASSQMKSRLLVIKAADDSASQYMNFMNVIFTAQKQSIPIDACILEKDSGLLQQACDITGGIYLKIPQIKGLLQYLLWVFLPDPSLRDTLVLPPAIHVDYRAACFCHRTLIDVGYVCSVCLSIFCTFSPICSTCHTAFKLKTAPVLKAKKKKKRASLPTS